MPYAGTFSFLFPNTLVVFFAGVIIGLLGKFVAPGDKDNIPIWLTILCGIGGVIIGAIIVRVGIQPITSVVVITIGEVRVSVWRRLTVRGAT